MKYIHAFIFAFCLFEHVLLAQTKSVAPSAQPNVLIILADDLGFSDLGCYGSEIKTPNLDQLASNGLRFTQFYNTGRCWPTRAALMTGYYPQQINRDKIEGLPDSKRGNRPNWAPLLSTRLKQYGYRCYHSGKWHIDGQPLQNGFHRSYRVADHGRYFSPKQTMLDDKRLPEVPRDSDYYATTAMADRAIEFLGQHFSEHGDKPFFQFLAFTAPHFPLHASPEDIEKYKGQYNAGWGKIRRQRWEKIQSLGIVSGKLSKVERNVGPPYHFPEQLEMLGPGEVNRPLPWNKLTPEQKSFQSAKMEIHAAMVDRMDQEIGRVTEFLKTNNAFDNTLIIFLSDNGASAEIMVRDDGHDRTAQLGSADSHLCLGPGWSNASNTPFRRHKTWVHEGGTRTPLIVHWPNGIESKNQLRKTPGHVVDIVPTLLDLCNSEKNQDITNVDMQFAGESLADVLEKDRVRTKDFLWWSHEGNRAVRSGNWKLVAAENKPWELFDLSQDPTESHNLADANPQKVEQLANAWNEFNQQLITNHKNQANQK
jgi:arylsulfatase A-like enzyme